MTAPKTRVAVMVSGGGTNLQAILDYAASGKLPDGDILLGGGAANDALLGSIKATLFDRSFVTLEESDTSALGAAMVAGYGIGHFTGLADATAACVQKKTVHAPIPALRDRLLNRFAIYEQLYTALKPQFEQLKEI